MKPAWSLTDKDVERMIAVFARTLAIALAEELQKRSMIVRAPDHTRFPMGPVRE